MNVKKIISRFLIFLLGIPSVLGLVFFKYLNNICLHAALLVVVALASIEMHNLLRSKVNLTSKIFLTVISTFPVTTSYFCTLFSLPLDLIFAVSIFVFISAILSEVVTPCNKGKNNYEESIYSMACKVFLVFYCGILPVYISRLTKFDNKTAYLCTYFAMVFSCDSLAWFFGMLLGKNNRGYVKISPNKSLVGFAGGIFGAIAAAVFCKFIFADAYKNTSYILIGFIGFICSIFAILGDLVESLLKRSADCKDSGHVIIGRGGILDSIDSLFLVIPVFFYMIKLFAV
ncbi:MAG: phosphatidate cytidylyltransferase [Treponemataceae bacterium]